MPVDGAEPQACPAQPDGLSPAPPQLSATTSRRLADPQQQGPGTQDSTGAALHAGEPRAHLAPMTGSRASLDAA